jgi:hypothetical protein
MKIMIHPLYSANLTLSDLSLFDYIKNIHSDYSFQSADDILSKIQVILAFIGKAVLLDIFAEWIRGLEQCCDINGNKLNNLNNHIFYLSFLWLDPMIRMGTWDTLYYV